MYIYKLVFHGYTIPKREYLYVNFSGNIPRCQCCSEIIYKKGYSSLFIFRLLSCRFKGKIRHQVRRDLMRAYQRQALYSVTMGWELPPWRCLSWNTAGETMS